MRSRCRPWSGITTTRTLTVRRQRILRAQRLKFSGYSRPLPAGPKNRRPDRYCVRFLGRSRASQRSDEALFRCSECGLEESRTGTERVNAAELQQFFRTTFYDGEGFWRVMEEPAAEAFGFLWIAIVPRCSPCKDMVCQQIETGRASRTPHERAGAAFRSALESPDKGRWYSTAFALG